MYPGVCRTVFLYLIAAVIGYQENTHASQDTVFSPYFPKNPDMTRSTSMRADCTVFLLILEIH